MDSHNLLGAIYGFDFFVVLLPMLYVAQRSEGEGCVWPWIRHQFPTQCNPFTGIMLAMYMWSITRFILMQLAIHGYIFPKLRRIKADHDAACKKEVILEYLRMRSRVPPEERDKVHAALARKSYFERGMHKYLPGSPFAQWAEKHGTSMESMTEGIVKYIDDGDEEVKNVLTHYWLTWGQRSYPVIYRVPGIWDPGHILFGDWA